MTYEPLTHSEIEDIRHRVEDGKKVDPDDVGGLLATLDDLQKRWVARERYVEILRRVAD